MLGKNFNKMKENTNLVKSILELNDLIDIHEQLDVLINSVQIFYESRDDFEKNYPEPDDLNGKINLIITRRY